MVYDMKAARLHTPQIILIDPDKVEQKNVGRQLYTEADVGQPKAHVLMRRFNMALGLDINAIDQPVSACADLVVAREQDLLINGAPVTGR
jgi:tRNA A37 threonylcarbamoyladenosine dehydratase